MLDNSVLESGWYEHDPRNCMICSVNLLLRSWLLTLDCWDSMQENPALSITIYARGCYMLWTWGRFRLRNYRRRSGVIFYRCCLVWNWSLQNGGNSETKVFSDEEWLQCGPNWLRKDMKWRSFLIAWTRSDILWGSICNHYNNILWENWIWSSVLDNAIIAHNSCYLNYTFGPKMD